MIMNSIPIGIYIKKASLKTIHQITPTLLLKFYTHQMMNPLVDIQSNRSTRYKYYYIFLDYHLYSFRIFGFESCKGY